MRFLALAMLSVWLATLNAEAAEQPNEAPPRPAKAKPKPRSSDRCYTLAIDCVLSERQAVGSSCWCVTPFGPSYGTVK